MSCSDWQDVVGYSHLSDQLLSSVLCTTTATTSTLLYPSHQPKPGQESHTILYGIPEQVYMEFQAQMDVSVLCVAAIMLILHLK